MGCRGYAANTPAIALIGGAKKKPPPVGMTPFVLERDATSASWRRNVNEALASAAPVALSDDRIVAAEGGLNRRVRPAARE
jgi:hypothetical protein